MLLCLSSSARDKYIDDIYTTLALPAGVFHQFRYMKDYIPSEVFGKISKNKLLGCKVLIGYLDVVDAHVPTKAIPCRFGEIVNSSVAGDICTLTFVVGEYAYSNDIAAANKELRNLFCNFPEWNNESIVEGFFCNELTNEPKSISATNDSNRDMLWLEIIKQVSKSFEKMSSTYHRLSHFYRLEGIFKGTRHKEHNIQKSIVKPNKNGIYELNSSQEYTLSVIHKQERKDRRDETAGKIKINSSESVNWLSRSELALDSRYDRVLLRLETPNTSDKKSLLLDFERNLGFEGEKKVCVNDFEIPIKLKPKWLTYTFYVVIITILLFSEYLLDSVFCLSGQLKLLISFIASLGLALAIVIGLPRI